MEEFKVNNYITLRLERDVSNQYETNIYVNGELFKQCKVLLLEIPTNQVDSLNDIDSIDEAAELLDKILEHENNEEDVIEIPPETEFWGHCSNLQVWAENNYDTRLLRSNLSFPLLKKLTEVGDPLANGVFKEEIIRRLDSGYPNVIKYLIEEKYINYLNREDVLSSLLKPEEVNIILELENIPGTKFKIEETLERIPEGRNSITIKDKGVIRLQMSGQNLKEPPFILTKFKALKYLFISAFDFEKIPDWIGNFEHLESLDISSCELQSIPEAIGKLKSLKKLNLFNNYLITLPEFIGELTNLVELNCRMCRLESLPESIGNLKQLRILNLTDNELRKLPLSIINLRNLESIYISGNRFMKLPEILLILPKIKEIDINK
ncbi:hypothetical protein LCGC14_1454190, partial [marine sediment metagenome]